MLQAFADVPVDATVVSSDNHYTIVERMGDPDDALVRVALSQMNLVQAGRPA